MAVDGHGTRNVHGDVAVLDLPAEKTPAGIYKKLFKIHTYFNFSTI
jgi:hypothetical protein